MPQQKRPEQRSSSSQTTSSDQTEHQPTGSETYKPRKRAATSERETDEAWEQTTATQNNATAPEEMLNDSVARLQEVAIEYFGRLGDTAGDLTQQARKVFGNGRTYAGSHPSATLGGAFIFGMLIGFLMDRD